MGNKSVIEQKQKNVQLVMRRESVDKPDFPGTARNKKTRICDGTQLEFEWGNALMTVRPVDVSKNIII